MKSKIIIFSILFLFIISLAFSYPHFIKIYDNKLFSEWVAAFDSGNLEGATKIANKMAWFDEKGSAYYLAHIRISESIQLSGQAKIEMLTETLKNLERARYSIPGAPSWQFLMQKSSVNALLGNKNKALEYAEEACQQGRPLTIEECLNGRFSYDDPQGSKWEAIQFYEKSNIYNLIGESDKFESKFYEAVSVKYFNVNKANALLGTIVNDQRYTKKMLKMYCSPESPVDIFYCKAN
jgi:hypothetical protein